jgi:glycosyltransferase involved in cell wall biosynthesis
VLTIHDLSLLLYPETHEERRVRRARRRLPVMVRLADMIVVPTESVKKEVCQHLPVRPDKVVVTHEAPRRCFQPMAPEDATETLQRLGVKGDFILYVGTIEPRKNLITLIRAFQEILSTTQLLPQLVIAGNKGWLTDELFAYIERAQLGDRLLLTGYLGDHDLQALFSTCATMVYPALYEGAGLPPLEAMACGAPVITTETAAISEMVGNGARLVAAKDHRAMAQQIVEVISDKPARRSLISAGLKRAAEFTWEQTARMTLDVYREAIERHNHKKK